MRSRAGFTLIELLIVVFILAMLAASASSMVDSGLEQARFDVTRQRLDELRSAVAGDGITPSGFASDCGRLPTSISELMTKPAGMPAWTVDPDGFGYGWRGPYLRATGPDTFFDGWGNPDSPDGNYGWKLFRSGPPSTPVIVTQGAQSYTIDAGPELWIGSIGLDMRAGTSDDQPHAWTAVAPGAPPVFPAGVPDGMGGLRVASPLVALADYMIDVKNWPVRVVVSTGASSWPNAQKTVALRVFTVDENGAKDDRIVDSRVVGAATIADGDSLTFQFSSAARLMTWGVRVAELVEQDAAGDWNAIQPPMPAQTNRASLLLAPRRALPTSLPAPWRVR